MVLTDWTAWTARLALAGVSAIAAVVSYFHALAVVRATGTPSPVVYLVPFLADLVILGASAALLASKGERPRLAMISLGVAIGVTVSMNVAAGLSHGVTGALVAGWPAVAFILALESLASIVRRDRAPAVPVAVPAPVKVRVPSVREIRTRQNCSQATAEKVRAEVKAALNGHGDG